MLVKVLLTNILITGGDTMLKCRFIIASYLIDSSVKAPLGTFNKGKALVGTVYESCLANTNVYGCHNWGTRTLMLLHMLRSPWPGEAAVLPGMGDTPPPPPPPPSGVSGPPRSTPSPSCGGSLYAPIQFSILGRFFCLQSLDFSSTNASQSHKLFTTAVLVSNFLGEFAGCWFVSISLLRILDGIVSNYTRLVAWLGGAASQRS